MQFITRAQWGAKPATSRTALKSKLGFAAHWEGPKLTLKSPEDAMRLVRQIQSDHMSGRNSDRRAWSDIAYNFLVDAYGNVYEGRGWDNRSAANGNATANASYIAVCYLGGEGNPFTAAAQKAIAELMTLGRSQHGVGKDLFPHSHFHATKCPGDDIRKWIETGVDPSVVPTPQQSGDDMSYERTVKYPDGSQVQANLDGSVWCAGAPSYGSFFSLRPDEAKDLVLSTIWAHLPVDINDKTKGTIVYTFGKDGKTVHEWKFDAEFLKNHQGRSARSKKSGKK